MPNQYLTGRSEVPAYEKLLVAPRALRDPLLWKVAREAEAPAKVAPPASSAG